MSRRTIDSEQCFNGNFFRYVYQYIYIMLDSLCGRHIEWSYIIDTLQTYNFGPDFIKWFRLLYKDASSCVINNGVCSQYFQLGRGCRQGDPLSPYLFILAVEPLSMQLKNDKSIPGINIGKNEYKLGQYADDTFLLLDGSERSIRNTFHILTLFGGLSGLRVNVEKTQIMWLGKQSPTNTINIPLNTLTEIRLLGITISNNLERTETLNYNDILIKVSVAYWTKPPLSVVCIRIT